MKKVLGILAGLMVISSIGFAAPIVNTDAHEIQVGYGSADIEGVSADNLFLQYGVTDKLSLSLEQTDFGKIGSIYYYGELVNIDFKYTDFKAHYKIADGVRIFAGNRDYELTASSGSGSGSATESDFLYGIGVTVPLGEKLTAYGSWQKADVVKDYQIGASYQIDPKLSAFVSYNKYDIDGVKADGTAFGVSYKF